MSAAESLFDYSEKDTAWIAKILHDYRDILLVRPGQQPYVKIVASAEAELHRRGVPV
jgi:hypothetical protein